MALIREATHAGSWYSADGPTLSKQLDEWLGQVPNRIPDIGDLPQEDARAIIAPHAGYAYSGSTAAWAYKSLDLSGIKRIFLLGPSHHLYLNNCALSQCTQYRTPMGDLKLDTDTIAELHRTGKFGTMTKQVDEEEHSLEMQLPYIFKVISRHFAPGRFPTLVPILVGSTTPTKEREYGDLFAPYVEDETSIFIASSDFCHWGLRFSYTYYVPHATSAPHEGRHLRTGEKPKGQYICDSIDRVDRSAMELIEAGSYEPFISNLQATGNTICGRHPIGIVMCALENLKGSLKLNNLNTNFRFVQYTRSSECRKVSDSSVSYASAFAVVEIEDGAAELAEDVKTSTKASSAS